MLKQLRQTLVWQLWQDYYALSPTMQCIEQALSQQSVKILPLDHLAIIDLPGPHSGIPHLHPLFSLLGYKEQGRGYLADKQNDFVWMTEIDSDSAYVQDVLPQVVIADFRLDEMPANIRHIIEKYSRLTAPLPFHAIKKQISQLLLMPDKEVETQLLQQLRHYFTGRDWPLPSTSEFHTVREFNELLAWVLIFGRRPNHFTLSIHLLNQFDHLTTFGQFIEHDLQLPLNRDGGLIKGSPDVGIEQASTIGMSRTVTLADGDIALPGDFVEFVWRYPKQSTCDKPVFWNDYFTDFIAQQANHVIKSLYVAE